jgi:hypothetical protein
VICKVLVDGPRIARWKLDCIALLRESNDVEVCGLGESRRDGSRSLARRFLGGGALRPAPVSANPDASRACDVVLDLRTNAGTARPDVGRAAYWFFCDGDGGVLGELPGAREIADGSPTFTLELRTYRTDEGFAALRSGTFKSLYTYARSMEIALEECKRWPALALEVGAVLGRLPDRRRTPPHYETPKPPLARLALRLAGALLSHVFVHLFVDARWSVGLIHGSPGNFLAKNYRPQIQWLGDRSAEFLADPFVFRLPDSRYIMCERLDGATRTGFISCLEVEDGGKVLGERAVIRSASHLSYPYVFEHDGTWYMVPESAQDRCVALYRGLDLPYKWERVATLIEGVATCDNTLVRHDGRWWLFCTHKSRDSSLNLFLYHARDLLGPWQPHVANPVKTDVRSCRPAGMPFLSSGELYRPAQDCARGYGDAITFNRVTALTEHEFSEELVSTFRRDLNSKASHGAHTMSYSDGMMAIDSKTVVFASPKVIRRRLGALATRIVCPAT